MSLSDYLYPGNPVKRQMIIRRSQELLELMKNNFRATNQLIEIVNMQLNSSFTPIALNEKATVKENCDVFIQRVNEIQEKIKEVDEKLKEKLEPTIYEKLREMPIGSCYITGDVKAAVSAICGVSAAVLVAFIIGTKILIGVVCTCVKISYGIFAAVALGVLLDLVCSAILGHFERAQLEKCLAEYDAALAEFRPASEKYQDAITEVKVILKYMKK